MEQAHKKFESLVAVLNPCAKARRRNNHRSALPIVVDDLGCPSPIDPTSAAVAEQDASRRLVVRAVERHHEHPKRDLFVIDDSERPGTYPAASHSDSRRLEWRIP
ncbi:MAG: hypothetical protein IT175_09595 [Acidobacteria bacterium]|nr:hypothetical protein [Acidobacteriota bacterium]